MNVWLGLATIIGLASCSGQLQGNEAKSFLPQTQASETIFDIYADLQKGRPDYQVAANASCQKIGDIVECSALRISTPTRHWTKSWPPQRVVSYLVQEIRLWVNESNEYIVIDMPRSTNLLSVPPDQFVEFEDAFRIALNDSDVQDLTSGLERNYLNRNFVSILNISSSVPLEVRELFSGEAEIADIVLPVDIVGYPSHKNTTVNSIKILRLRTH